MKNLQSNPRKLALVILMITVFSGDLLAACPPYAALDISGLLCYSSGTATVSSSVVTIPSNSYDVTVQSNNVSLINNAIVVGDNQWIAILNNYSGFVLQNNGTIGDGAGGLVNNNSIISITNDGTIESRSTNVSRGYAILNGLNAASTIDSLTNNSSGVIFGKFDGVRNSDSSTINTIANSGTIYGVTGNGIYNGDSSILGVITNTGAIYGAAGSYGIYNNGGSITTLNNGQGGDSSTPSTTALTIWGRPPSNYNIIVSSATHYGQIITSATLGSSVIFGISPLSTTGNAVLGTYSSVINGLSSSALGFGAATTSGVQTSNGYTYTLNETGALTEIWDLVISAAPGSTPSGPTAADTQESLTQAASALRSVFNQQTAVSNNSLNYDCTVFAENGVCVSAGGRFATSNSITGEKVSTLLVASYKAMKNVRLGGFIDQNKANPTATGVSVDQSPMYGVFGVWNQNPDLMGYEVRLSSNWSDQSITQTRNVVGTSEAGVGSASLKTKAISGVVSYAMPVTDSTWIASPYVGVRKTKVSRGGYTETSAVTTPLTFSDLSQDITTALAGVRMNKKFNDNVYLTGSVGVEQNVGSNISTLDASGVTGLTATDFSANYAKTRPVASVGASYAIDKNQRVSLSAMYRKEAFQSSGSTTALLMYQVGL